MSVAPNSTVTEAIRNLRAVLAQIQVIVDINPLFRVDTRIFTGAVSLVVALRTEWVRYYVAQCIRLSLENPFQITDAILFGGDSVFQMKYGYSMVDPVVVRGDRAEAATMVKHYQLLYDQPASPQRLAAPLPTAGGAVPSDDQEKQQAFREVSQAILDWYAKYDDRTYTQRTGLTGNPIVDGFNAVVRAVSSSLNATVSNGPAVETIKVLRTYGIVREVVDNIIYNQANTPAVDRCHYTQRIELANQVPPVLPTYPSGVPPMSEAYNLLSAYDNVIGWVPPGYGEGFNGAAATEISVVVPTDAERNQWIQSFIIYTFLERGAAVPGDLNPFFTADGTKFLREAVEPYQAYVASIPPKPSPLLAYLQTAEVRQLVDQIIFESAPGGPPAPPYNKTPGFVPPVDAESAGDKLLLYYEAIYGCDFTGTPQRLAQYPNEQILRTYVDIITAYTFQKRGLTPPASNAGFYDPTDGTAFNTSVVQAYLNPQAGPPPESGFPTPEPGIFTIPLPSGGIEVNLSSQESREDAIQLVLNEMARSNPDIARILSMLTVEERDNLVAELAAGDIAAFGADAVKDLLAPMAGGILRNTAIADLLKGKLNWAARPDPNPAAKPSNPEAMYPADWKDPIELNRFSEKAKARRDGNVGHKGTMVVRLGGVPFEIPPAIDSNTQAPGGQMRVPRTMPGIGFTHTNNQAELSIPGSVSVYQALGVQRMRIQFVGAFLGYDHKRRMNGDKTFGALAGQKKEYYNTNSPDPLYTSSGQEGGSWAMSRRFQGMVFDGMPREFEIFSGIVQIKYSVIVQNFERLYRDDTRTYYFFDCLAINAAELTQAIGHFTSNLPARRANILASSVRIVAPKPKVAAPPTASNTVRPGEQTPAQMLGAFDQAQARFDAAKQAGDTNKMQTALAEMNDLAKRLSNELPPTKKQQLVAASSAMEARNRADTARTITQIQQASTSGVAAFLSTYNQAAAQYQATGSTFGRYLGGGALSASDRASVQIAYNAFASLAIKAINLHKGLPNSTSTLDANARELESQLNSLNGQLRRAGLDSYVRDSNSSSTMQAP